MIVNSTSYPRPVATAQTSPADLEDDLKQSSATTIDAAKEPVGTGDTVTIGAEEDSVENDDKARGVLRLLQQGHFKGVSDVRLRINFHDQIAAMEQSQMAAAVAASAPSLVEGVQSEIDALIGSDNLTEDQSIAVAAAAESFAAVVPQAVEEFAGASEFVSTVRAAFDEFTAAIDTALTIVSEPEPTEPPPVVDDPVPDAVAIETEPPATSVETPAEEIPSFSADDFIAGLIEAFTAALDKIEADLLATSALPEISEPNGQGRAFEKFMAIYGELRAATVTEPPAEPPIETPTDPPSTIDTLG